MREFARIIHGVVYITEVHKFTKVKEYNFKLTRLFFKILLQSVIVQTIKGYYYNTRNII